MSLIYNDAKATMNATNWAAYDVRAMLVGPSYTPNADHVFVNQVVGELTNGSYARQALLGRYGVVDTTNDLASFVANNPTWLSLAGGEQVQWLVLYKHVTNDSDSRLLYCIAVPPFTTVGDNCVIRFNNGLTSGVVFSLQGPPGSGPLVPVPRVGQLTDSTGGSTSTTIGDVGASFNQSALNNIHKALLDKINALELALHNTGVTQ